MTVFTGAQRGLGKVWNGIRWHGECRVMEAWTKTAAWAHSVEIHYWGEWGGGLKVQKPHYNRRGLRCLSVFFFLPFGYCYVGEAGGSKHSPENIRKEKINFMFPATHFRVTVWFCFFSLKQIAGTYVTSLREFLSSLPRFRIYCHCSSDRLWPPM